MAELEAREYELYLDHQQADEKAKSMGEEDRSKMTMRDKQVERQTFRKFQLRHHDNIDTRRYLENNNPDASYGLDPSDLWVDEAFQAG